MRRHVQTGPFSRIGLRFVVIAMAAMLSLTGTAAALLDDALPDTGSPTDDGLPDVGDLLPDSGDTTNGDEPPADDPPMDDPPADPAAPDDEPTQTDAPSDGSKVSSDLDGSSEDLHAAASDGAGGNEATAASTGHGPADAAALTQAEATPGSSEFVGPVFHDSASQAGSSSAGEGSSTIGRPVERDVPGAPVLGALAVVAALGAALAALWYRRR